MIVALLALSVALGEAPTTCGCPGTGELEVIYADRNKQTEDPRWTSNYFLRSVSREGWTRFGSPGIFG